MNMNVYIWQYVKQCSTSYHSGGGVVVIAETLEDAVALANSQDGCVISPDELPDEVRPCQGGNKAIYIMPDAGCC
jgi:hypothetical protein